MSRQTIASVTAQHAIEIAALNDRIAALEARLVVAMTVLKNRRTRISELESALNDRIAALEARLVVATTVLKNRRTRISELESALNMRGVKPARPVYVPAAPTAETLAWRRYCAEQAAAAKDSGKSVKSISRTEFGAWFAEQAQQPETIG